MGTVSYMSPEQARGQKVDARSDTFSLGVMLYEMVAGAPPFTGGNAVEVLAAILDKEPPPLRQRAPDAPLELERIIDQALRKDRAERYQHVKDLLHDMKELKQELEFAAKASRANEGAPSRETSSSKIILGEIKRHKLGVTLMLAALALATAAWFFYSNRQPALTEKDTILLADFVNNTGDAVFDGTLKEALAVHLGQSPFLNILSAEEALKAYSLAKELFRQGKRYECIPHFNRAIHLDPNFASAYTWLEATYRATQSEKYEKAIEEAREDMRLNPHDSDAYVGLARALIRLGRFEEAREIYERAQQQNLDSLAYNSDLHALAFVQADTSAMKSQIDGVTGRKNEYLAFQWQATTAAFAGQLRRAREFSRKAIDLAERRDLKEVAAGQALSQALAEATVGHCPLARTDTTRALALAPRRYYLATAARVLALCGETGRAQKFADEVASQYPKDTLIKTFEAPLIRAAIELHRRNPDQAIESLQPTGSYGAAFTRHHGLSRFWPVYLRGQSYLLKRAGTEAAAEFQKILDHRGWDPTSHLYPLAHLGLARAAAFAGDKAKIRKAYQDFFALWKDADADLPLLIEAKKEFEKLK